MCGNIPFIREEDCQQAFARLKLLLITAPILGCPITGLEYILETDASNAATGAVLSQMQEGHEIVIAYYSISFSDQGTETFSALFGRHKISVTHQSCIIDLVVKKE